MLNIRNYSPMVINNQQREAQLNIILTRVNNFDIRQIFKASNICFIICQQHQTRSGKIKANKKHSKFGQNMIFFCKNGTTAYVTI